MVPSSLSWPPSDPVDQSVSQLKGYFINGIFYKLCCFKIYFCSLIMIKAIFNLECNIYYSASNLDHLTVPSSQLLSELITQVVMELNGQYTVPFQM